MTAPTPDPVARARGLADNGSFRPWTEPIVRDLIAHADAQAAELERLRMDLSDAYITIRAFVDADLRTAAREAPDA